MEDEKRVLSALLTTSLMLSLLPAQVLVAEEEYTSALASEEVLELLPGNMPDEETEGDSEVPTEIPLSEPENLGSSMPLADAPTSGTCGVNLTWTLSNAGTLTISGTGNMMSYSTAPWHDSCNLIKDIKFEGAATSIGQYAFRGCTNLTDVAIPHTITYIGNYAFSGCSSLTNVIIPASVTTLGSRVFENCTSLMSVNIPSSITTIGNYVFKDCSSLTKADIPSSITTIGYGAFSGCYELAHVTIPSSVTDIKDSAFSDCRNLTHIIIPSSVTVIGKQVFRGCNSLTSVDILSSITDIGDDFFSHCSSLVKVTIPSSVIRIGEHAFSGCSALTNVNIPPSVESIGYGAFDGCHSLMNVNIPPSVTSIGVGAFTFCTGLTSITISSPVEIIDDYMFSNCTELSFFNIPPSATSIGASAFVSCTNLMRINIPATVTSIGNGAFWKCSNLTDVYYGGTKEQWNAIAVDKYNESLTSATIHYNFFDEQVPEDDESIEINSNLYYALPEDRLFRIRPMGVSYPSPAGFTVTVENTEFRSGYETCSSTDDITVAVPLNYAGNITVSREGYYTNTIPAEWTGSTNYVAMTPITETGPFAQALFLDGSKNGYKKFFNELFGDLHTVYVRELSEPAETFQCYVSMNWNNHGAGSIWLEQGDKKILLSNNASTEVALGDIFIAGKYVYLCAEAADGATLRQKTCISMLENKNSSIKVDLGEALEAKADKSNKNTSILSDESISIDFSKLSDDSVPIKFEIKSDGTVTGIIGLQPTSGSYSEAAYGKVKEAFSRLTDPTSTSQNIEIAKCISEMKAEGRVLKEFPHSSFGVKGNMQLLGYFSGNLWDGKLRLTEMKGVIIVGGSFSYTHNTIIMSFPAYFKISLAAKVATAVKMKYDDLLDKYTVVDDQPFTGTVSVSAEAGPGWEGFLSGGVKGSGAVKIYSSLPVKKSETNVSLSAQLSFVGTLAGISGEWTICKTPEMIFWDAGEWVWREKGKALSEDMAFVPNLQQTPMLFAAMAGGNCVTEGVSGYMAPSLAELSDGQLLAVWTADVPGRNGVDKNGIYYSIKVNNGTWSAPQLVWDDGTNDSLPKLWKMGGEVWLTWQNYTQTFQSDSLDGISYDTIATQVDIAAARFNSETGTFAGVNIPCIGYAYQSQMRSVNGQVSIAWMDESNSLWSCTYSGSGWTNATQGTVDWYEYETVLPSTYTGEAPHTSSLLQTFTTSDYQAILYTAENDEEVSNVYGLFNDGFGWGSPVQLTDASNGSIGGFSAVISRDNVIQILANKIHYDVDGSYIGANLELYEKSLSADLAVTAADYVHDTLVPGGTLTVSVDVANNSAQTVSGLIVRVSGDSISTNINRAVTLLPGQSKTVYANCDLPGTFSREFSITVEPQNGADVDLSDNTATCALQMTDISLEKVFANQTETEVSLTAMIVNRGSTDIQGYTVTYHIGEPDGEIIGSEYADTALLPGEAVYLNSTVSTRLEPESMIYAEVDMMANVEENLYGNNSSQTLVLRLGQDSEEDTISIANWNSDSSSTYVELNDPASLLGSESKIIAAIYVAGKMTDVAEGVWSSDAVTFSKKLAKGWTIFLLDANNMPVCPQINLS